MRYWLSTIFLLILIVQKSAWASSTRSIDADQIQSSDHTKTQTMPGASGTLLNTVSSNVPIAASLVQEVPSGTVNTSNVTFSLANTPGGSSSVFLNVDGIAQVQGVDYTISGATITMTAAPATGQTLYAFYSKF